MKFAANIHRVSGRPDNLFKVKGQGRWESHLWKLCM